MQKNVARISRVNKIIPEQGQPNKYDPDNLKYNGPKVCATPLSLRLSVFKIDSSKSSVSTNIVNYVLGN